jgi:3-oxoacyl-[acyl-carrier-protein] synthase II
MMFGFSRMKVVSMAHNDRPAEASRPFDRGRDGFVLGEGAWMLVEREDRARARGAKIYAAIEGYGSTCDAYHRVQMAPSGAGDRPRDLDRDRSLRAAAGGDRLHQLPRHFTLINDAVESRCVREVFGDRAEQVLVHRSSR